MASASWTLLRNGELRVERVLDQDHSCPPGASHACLPILDRVQPNPAVPYRSTGRTASPALPMLVLYRPERQAEALQVYRFAQPVLRSELSLEPCRSPRRLHRANLTSDRLLDLPVAS